MKYPVKVGPDAIIAFFGSRDEVYAALQKTGCLISRKSVNKWTERGYTPPEAVLALLSYARSVGREQEFMEKFIP